MSEENKNVENENIQSADTEKTEPCNCGCDGNGKKKSCRCKIKKAVLYTIGTIAGILALLLIFRDFYIPFAVSKAGTFALGTKVELKKFSSSLTGKVDIQGLTVANPEGYQNPTAFNLDRVYVDLSVASIFSDEILIREILVTGMKVDLESKLNRTNLGELQKNVERLVPQQSAADDDNEPEAAKEEKPAKSVVIEKLDINNNHISFSNSALNLTVNVPLIPVSMTNVGKGQSIAETLNEVLLRIITSVFDACASVGGVIGDSLKGAGAILSDSAANLGKGVSDAAQGLGKGLSDGTKDLGKGISETTKKLFKGF